GAQARVVLDRQHDVLGRVPGRNARLRPAGEVDEEAVLLELRSFGHVPILPLRCLATSPNCRPKSRDAAEIDCSSAAAVASESLRPTGDSTKFTKRSRSSSSSDLYWWA